MNLMGNILLMPKRDKTINLLIENFKFSFEKIAKSFQNCKNGNIIFFFNKDTIKKCPNYPCMLKMIKTNVTT